MVFESFLTLAWYLSLFVDLLWYVSLLPIILPLIPFHFCFQYRRFATPPEGHVGRATSSIFGNWLLNRIQLQVIPRPCRRKPMLHQARIGKQGEGDSDEDHQPGGLFVHRSLSSITVRLKKFDVLEMPHIFQQVVFLIIKPCFYNVLGSLYQQQTIEKYNLAIRNVKQRRRMNKFIIVVYITVVPPGTRGIAR